MAVDTELNDGLTDEERAALAEDDGAAAATTTEEDATNAEDAAAAEDTEDDSAAGAGDDAAAADAGADSDAAPGRDDGEPAADVSEQPEGQASQSAPILIAEAPADADAKLADIATAKSDLLTKFDDGDITAKEYQAELDKLNRQELDINLDLREAKLAEKMEQQRLQNEWVSTVNRFIEANPIYKPDTNPRLYRALDQEVKDLAVKPEAANWSGEKILQEAHKNLAAAFNLVDPASKQEKITKQPVPKPNLPPTLAKVPAAEGSETGNSKWGALDRMATTDPLGYEEALAKMSDADRNAYLAA